jgi:dolichyl-phosphate beta-glucosyltransferase
LQESLALSVVLPAYNEAARLPPYLASVKQYLEANYPRSHEVIVVDDGSTDGLGEFLAEQCQTWKELRPLRHERNLGKGAAVRTGMLASRGRLALFADADGATPIEAADRLIEALAEADVAIGSRLLEAPGMERRRAWHRGLAGRLFAAMARRVVKLPIRDTQCGFKLFRGDVARRLFAQVTQTGYMFDLELLALAQRAGLRVVEVPVPWREVPGGHLSLIRDLPRIVRDLWRLSRQLDALRAIDQK